MKQTNLRVEQVETTSLIPYEKNTKIHKEKQVNQIAYCMLQVGFVNPMLIDENDVIIAGHGRWLAAKQLGMQEVPVIRLKHLSEAQKKTYRIADNKLTENGLWDYDLLKLELSDLEKLELDFSLDITGFDLVDIDVILDPGLKKKDTKPDEEANAVPFIPEEEVVSTLGDIWQLGKHRIICGSSLEELTFDKLFEGKKADTTLCDAPYNVQIDGHVGGKGKIKHKEFAMASGEMSKSEFTHFLKMAMTLQAKYSVDGSIHFQCMDWRHMQEMLDAGLSIYSELKNLCVWNKDNGGMGSLYRSKHELVFVFKNGTKPHINNVELGSHGRYRTNVWDYAGINSFGKEKDNLKYHPTVKPMEMVRDAILDVTNRGQIVLDAFLGSGTTLIAAEKCGRICYGIELDPLYIDTAIRRWEDITGEDAINVGSGKSYKELLLAKKEGV
jgi:DNA modification methylase